MGAEQQQKATWFSRWRERRRLKRIEAAQGKAAAREIRRSYSDKVDRYGH
jgi:hypothetical protein